MTYKVASLPMQAFILPTHSANSCKHTVIQTSRVAVACTVHKADAPTPHNLCQVQPIECAAQQPKSCVCLAALLGTHQGLEVPEGF